MGEAIAPTRRSGGTLAVLGVFVLGLVCGAALFFAAARLAERRALPFVPRLEERGGRMAIAHMVRELDLDAAQREQVRAVIERSRGEVADVLERSRAEIRALLRPDQQEKFDRMRPAGAGFHRGGRARPPLRED